jgi:hypothetical protein
MFENGLFRFESKCGKNGGGRNGVKETNMIKQIGSNMFVPILLS